MGKRKKKRREEKTLRISVLLLSGAVGRIACGRWGNM
jgi:hypothetical protein